MSAQHRTRSSGQVGIEAFPESASRDACFYYKLGKRDSTFFCAKTLTLPAVSGAKRELLPSTPIQHPRQDPCVLVGFLLF